MLEALRLRIPFLTGKAKVISGPKYEGELRSKLEVKKRECLKCQRRLAGIEDILEHAGAEAKTLKAIIHADMDWIASIENEIETGERLDEPRPASHWFNQDD